MRIDVGQHMGMRQEMKLSPRMIQSMEILQLPLMALEERIEQELSENPVLELAAVEPEEPQAERAPDEADDAAEPLVVDDSDRNQTEDFRRLDNIAEQYGQQWEQNTGESSEYRPARRNTGERDAKIDAMANTAARAAPLTDQLYDQWRFVEADPTVRDAGALLIEFIDDDGYFRTDLEPVLNQAPAHVTRHQLEQALQLIRERMDPTGIGATDLSDCLRLQIDARLAELEDEADAEPWEHARLLLDDHLKDVEMNRLPRIVQRTGLTIDQVKAALSRLRRLDPHPGRRLAPETPQAIYPDVIVEYDPIGDEYVAALSRGRQPALRISPQYRKLSKDRSQDRSTRQYLAGHMSNARWLIDSLDQRNNTLLRVVRAVIEHQRDFLDHGPEHLKPLPMIHLADQLGIHVGTVSRAVSEKYVQTPRGIYPLRMFFSGGTESTDGQEMSWGAVQAKLKQVIDKEDKSKPLSDEQLVEAMKAKGIEIARRTVAKYRQQLNIPPARRRKQF